MDDAIFLSASVPDPKRGKEYAETADPVLISSAVSALVHVILGRRPLVWGGHPAITPMIWVVAEDIGVEYGSWVHLYQSTYFDEDFPEENKQFENVTLVEAVANDRQQSLLAMRETLLKEQRFSAAVFIGGMGGILDEFDLFRRHQPSAAIIPVVSTGGAVLEIAKHLPDLSSDFAQNLDYVALFHKYLGVSVRENRFVRPEQQPNEMEDRYWNASPSEKSES